VIVLAIESATELVGVAVADDGGPRAAAWATGRRRHGEALAPAIAAVLEQAEVTLADLGAVAVDVGPGLFTGLRVGVATAKGLAQGLGIGVVTVTSVDVLARAAFDAGWPGEVVAVVDARRSEVFAARYVRGAHGAAVESSPAARYGPDELAAALSARPAGGRLAVGDGARRYAGVLAGVAGLTLAGGTLAGPPPAVLATLAVERLADGEPPGDAAAVVPRYLRDADARINWVQRAAPA
jgi:tRNA threonylcarbamoyladenosine biosynthesis protein TsaB